MEWLTETKHSDFGRSCLSLAAWRGQGFWALCLPMSQSLGREMEACGPADQALPSETALQPRWHPHSPVPTAAFLVSPHSHPRGCKSPETVKTQQPFSPVLRIFEDRRQADLQPFAHARFLHTYAKITVTEGEITKIPLCCRKSTDEIQPKFTE